MNQGIIPDTTSAMLAEPAVGKRRVYVVDDNRDVRRSLHFSLSALGIDVRSFVCAQDLLGELDTLAPSPILLDIRMPKIDGLETLARLRERNVHWPVIMMSAHGDIPIAVESIKLGAVDFLEKPFELGVLEELLMEAWPKLQKAVQVSLTLGDMQRAWAQLTPREEQVLNRLSAGAPNKAVAREFGLSVRTIENHRANGLAKLGLKSMAEVVALKFSLQETGR